MSLRAHISAHIEHFKFSSIFAFDSRLDFFHIFLSVPGNTVFAKVTDEFREHSDTSDEVGMPTVRL